MFRNFSPQAIRLIALFVILLLVLAFFSSQINNYFNARLFLRISTSVAIMAIISSAQTIVMLARQIDLSVGSIVGFTAFAAGDLIAQYPGIGGVGLAIYAMVVGAAFGMVNGVIVAYLRVPAIIVTRATMAIFRSLLVEFSGAKSITTASLPVWLTQFPNTVLFSIGGLDFRAVFVLAVAVVVAVYLILTFLRPARKLYAVGSNPEAAEMAGINQRLVILLAFVASGTLAGLAGFIFLARFGNITVVAGLGFELKSVAAAVVGGVSINGGTGSVIGALIGAILVDTIDTSLVRWPLVSEFWREAVLGLLILLAVAADAVLGRRLMVMRIRREKEKRT